MKFEAQYPQHNPNVTASNDFADFVKLGLYLLGIVVAVYLALGFAAEKIAERMSPEAEKRIGSLFAARMITEKDFPKTQAYAQGILDRLVAVNKDLPPFEYAVTIIDDKTVNAVAFPAGHIIFYKGLLENIKSENELAMILGHELAHYGQRDHLRGFGRGLVLMAIVGALGLSGDLPGFIVPSVQTFDLRFSREQEASADRLGMDMVHAVYGHVGGAANVLTLLAEEDKKQKTPGFFSTHPDSLWRRQALRDYAASQQYLFADERVVPVPEPGQLPFPEDIIKK